MSTERSVSREGNKVYLVEENDGWSYAKRGPETRRTEIVRADEKGLHMLGGGTVSSSDGSLHRRAMEYFADIANESRGKQTSPPTDPKRNESPRHSRLGLFLSWIL